MTLPVFTSSRDCASRTLCLLCRARDGGRGWRVGTARRFALPPGAPDFDCPHGLPWDIKRDDPRIHQGRPTPPDPAESLTIEQARAAIDAGRIPRSVKWPTLPNVQAAYRAATADFIASIPLYPTDRYAGRGIVIVGGGGYFTSAFTLIRLLRSLGCTLPIELWGLPGELPAWQQRLVAPHGVRCIRWSEVSTDVPIGRRHGWELKTFAAIHTSFAYSIHLDADSFPCQDPTFLLDAPQFQQTGAIFWPDLPGDPGALGDDLLPAVWEAVGLPPRPGEWAFESGQFVIDRRAWWRGLNLSHWLCRHGWDYYFKLKIWYGDKECPHVAARLLGIDYAQPSHRPATDAPMLLQRDLDGAPLFAHHTRDKFWLKTPRRAAFEQIPCDGLLLDLLAEAQSEILAARPRIHGLFVCVDYADYLAQTIAHNLAAADAWTCVTVAGDASIELCRKHGITVVLTDRIHANGSKFNLGAARNDGYRAIAASEPDAWIMSVDADCQLPAKFRDRLDDLELDPASIYGARRIGGHHEDNALSGFFQLFHVSHIPARLYDETHHDAGETDILFRDLWPDPNRVEIPGVQIRHLGRPGMDWEGRVSSRTDGRMAVRQKSFPERWRELHLRPSQSADLSREPRWHEFFARDLPCGACKTDWSKLRKAKPFRIYDREAYARDTWARHNDVSRGRLPGPLFRPFPWAGACKLYDWPESLYPNGRPPTLAQRPIRIYGLHRTATNLAELLIGRNFDVRFVHESISGWKHGHFQDTLEPDERIVLCVRHPLSHLASFYAYCCRDYGIDPGLPPQFRPDMSFAEFVTSACYEFESPAHRWTAMYAHWLESLPSERTVLVRQEDQIEDQAWVVGMVGRRLALTPALSPEYTTDRRVDVNGSVRDEPAQAPDLSGFTPELIAAVAASLTPALLATLGYSL